MQFNSRYNLICESYAIHSRHLDHARARERASTRDSSQEHSRIKLLNVKLDNKVPYRRQNIVFGIFEPMITWIHYGYSRT